MGGTLRPCSRSRLRGTVYIENLGDDDDWYTEGNETILDRADELADGGSIYALVVRLHSGESNPSTTDLFAESAAKRDGPSSSSASRHDVDRLLVDDELLEVGATQSPGSSRDSARHRSC